MGVVCIIPYGRKFWWRIYFGGLTILRATRQYFHPPNFLQYVKVTYYYVTSSICRLPSFKMFPRKLQTSKEWNKNSPNLVYHLLVPASFDVLWFETDPAVFTLLTVLVCYMSTFCYEYNYGIRLTQAKVKSAKCIIRTIRQIFFPPKFLAIRYWI